MSVSSSSQAAAEYFGVMANSAATALQSTTLRVSRFAMDNPAWIAVSILVVLLLIWWSRPRAR